jgi:hypothetical protein
VKPAATSADEASSGAVGESETAKPAKANAGAVNVAAGATFEMLTVVVSTAVKPPLSVTWTFTVRDAGPSVAARSTFWPVVSNVPFLSRSHAYVSGGARAKPARSLLVGWCSLPCGAAMLRVAASHQSACA